jgi:L-threonylcarbamoyladenylate synthase
MPRRLKVDPYHAAPIVLQEALAILRRGGVVAYPTDTVYGLAVDALNPDAVARLYSVKRRPREKAVPLIISGLEQLSQLVAPLSCAAKRMMAVFWPGPLTLLMSAHEQAPQHLLSEGRRIGVRWPQVGLSQQLALGLGGAVTATSANLSGCPVALSASEVVAQLDSTIDLVLDGGVVQSSEVSTILDVDAHPPRLIRAGRLSVQEIEAELGRTIVQD